MPKRQVEVDYGPVWDDVVEVLGQPLGGEPSHSEPPTFDRSADEYRPWFDDAAFAPPTLDGVDELLAYDVDELLATVTARLREVAS